MKTDNILTQADSAQSHSIDEPIISLFGNNGYHRIGNRVRLFADRIDNVSFNNMISGDLSLQLWACSQAYSGGELDGTLVAEARIGRLQPGFSFVDISQEVDATFPTWGEYHLVFAVAEFDGLNYTRIQDFRTYADALHIANPQFEGNVNYEFENEQVLLTIEKILNPRSGQNMSGSLSLELWALENAYEGGDFTGEQLAGVELNTLQGGQSLESLNYVLPVKLDAAADKCVSLMLREWEADAYVTRDYINLKADAIPSVKKEKEKAPVKQEVAKEQKTQSKTDEASDKRLSVNKAKLEDISSVKGVNKKVAKAIVENRPFKKMDDLSEVKGIGKKTFEKLKAIFRL